MDKIKEIKFLSYKNSKTIGKMNISNEDKVVIKSLCVISNHKISELIGSIGANEVSYRIGYFDVYMLGGGPCYDFELIPF